MKQENQIPFESGSVLLDQGIRFKIPFFFWLKLPLTIRPLRPGTITAISQQVLLLEQVEESENMVQELLKTGNNLAIHCRIVAIGAMNGPFMIPLFTRIITWLLKWKIKSTAELLAYVSIVYRQMDAERFFFIMTLTKGMNFLNKKVVPESSGEETPSGEQSD